MIEASHKIADVEVPDDLEPAHEVELVGIDGNAGNIMSVVARGLRAAGNSKEVIDNFYAQCMEGDYDHLLRVAMVFTGQMD